MYISSLEIHISSLEMKFFRGNDKFLDGLQALFQGQRMEFLAGLPKILPFSFGR